MSTLNNSQISHKIEVRESEKHGKGLFANALIKEGEFIGTMTGEKTKKDGIHVLWTSAKEGIIVDNILKYSNHDWENPNSFMKKLSLYANKDIQKDEEIFWDYSCGYKYENEFSTNKPLFDNIGYAVIHHTILDNNLSLFKKVLDKLVKLKMDDQIITTDYHTDLIHFIGSSGTPEMLEYYLTKRRSLIIQNNEGYNFFHFAFMTDNTKLILKAFSLIPIKLIQDLLSMESQRKEIPLDFFVLKKNRKDKKKIINFLFEQVNRNTLDNHCFLINRYEEPMFFLEYLKNSDPILLKKTLK